MAAIHFDALIFSHQLTDAGMPREQAEKIAKIQKGAFDTQNQNVEESMQQFQENIDKKISAELATKKDLSDLKHDLKQDISCVRHEISNLKHEFKKYISDLDKKIDLLRKEFEGKFYLLYWMQGFILTFCCSIVFKLYFQ